LYATGKIILCGCCPAGAGVPPPTGYYAALTHRHPAKTKPKPKKQRNPELLKKIFCFSFFGRWVFFFSFYYKKNKRPTKK
ncbi:hypothetical protein, partial [Enterobacter hormaechei]